MKYHLSQLADPKFPVAFRISKNGDHAYNVIGTHSELICDCPQARYRNPRCKHVAMVEEALELQAYLGNSEFVYDMDIERMEPV